MLVYFVRDMLSMSRCDDLHRAMCHGVPWRDRERDAWDVDSPTVGTEPEGAALELEANIFDLRDVIKPATRFVVSDQVKRGLTGLRNIAFQEIKFKKLIDFPYYPGECWFSTDWLQERFPEKLASIADDEEAINDLASDAGSIYTLVDDVPNAHRRVPRYYEVLTWRHRDVIGQWPDAPEITALLSHPGEEKYGRLFTERVTAEMSKTYPILWSPEAHILSDDAFAIMGDYFDRDYFAIVSLDL
jgi:hypothetical protein